jgi:hypothetical protein
MKMRKRLALGSLLAVMSISLLCGCGQKEKDPSMTEVMKISITPKATPTEEPERMNPDAVVTNGSITMVNEYTKNDISESADTSEEQAESGENSGSEDTEESGQDDGYDE